MIAWLMRLSDFYCISGIVACIGVIAVAAGPRRVVKCNHAVAVFSVTNLLPRFGS